jgi:hypothetical protein
LSETSHLSAAQGKFNSEALEVNDDQSNDDGGDQVAEVWSILSVEGLLESVELVWLGQEEVEKSDDASLEFSSLISSNGNWRERFPEDQLTDVGGDEKGNT